MAQEQIIFRLYDVDLLTLAVHEIIPLQPNGGKFIISSFGIFLSQLTGAIGVTPIVRVGNNVNNDNLLALTTLTALTAVNKRQTVSLTTVDVIDIASNAINFEVQTAGTTATVMKADVFIVGYII